MKDYRPATVAQKFTMARQDSFDRGTIALGALFAAQSLATNANPSFGHGAAGYAKYFAAGYGDLVIGNMLTEGVYPSLLRQDPRYFPKRQGGFWGRFAYAAQQAVITRSDTGRKQFNYSEFLGNATAVAISNAYYPDNRTPRDAVVKFATQIAVDTASNLLKEFYLDIQDKWFHSRTRKTGSLGPGLRSPEPE